MRKLFLAVIILSLIMPNLDLICGLRGQKVYAFDKLDSPIECNGDQVEYFETEKKVVGSGNVEIKYKDMVLTCDKVTIWTETQEALAEGNVMVTQSEKVEGSAGLEQKVNTFGGETIRYNFEKSTGSIVDYAGHFDEWYAKGKSAQRLDAEEFLVKNGSITTCDHERPHWRISSNRVEIYPKRMVNIYNAVAWINPLSTKWDIPVLWIPYYCHPLDDDKPRVTLIPGKNKEWGYYLLTSWRYNLAPGQFGQFKLDYRERKDLAVGLNHLYDTRNFGKGNIFGYYMNERDVKWGHNYDRWRKKKEEESQPTTEQEKGLFTLRHQWEMTPNTLVTAELYKYKDENFLKDYFYEEWEVNQNPESYLLVSHTNSLLNASLLTKKRANRFEAVTELLPEAKIDINNTRILSSNFYFSGNYKAVNMNQVSPRHTDANPGTIPDPQHNNIYDSYSRLSYQRKLGFLSVTPYVATTQSFFQRSLTEDSPQTNGVFYTGFDVSTKFFKVFDVKAKPLGIEINRLRHVVTPTWGYGYTHPPTLTPGTVLGGDVTRSSTMSFSLENKLQTKTGQSGESTTDLAMLLVNTTYNFAHTPGGQLGDFTAKLELKPFSWLTATSDAIMDPHLRYHHQWLRQINNNIAMGDSDKWSLGLGQSYYAGANSLIYEANYNMLPGWKLKAYGDFDILGTRNGEKKKRDLKTQQYVITKDLHCWEMDVRYNVDRDKGEELMLIFRLKAFPDIPFEFGRSYHQPKVGSQAYEKQF